MLLKRKRNINCLNNIKRQIMDKQTKGRRNKKDGESRDYTCLCGKNYLSYAAAYTHSKNKHKGDKKYIDGIQKPAKQPLKRGRPKEKKACSQTNEATLLTLVESSILKICEELEGAFPKIILEGNQQRNQTEYNQCFKTLCLQNQQELQDINMNFVEEEFVQAIVKDFQADVAARVKLATAILCYQQQSMRQNISILNSINNLWNGKEKVNQTIHEALQQWWKLKGSHQQLFQPNEYQ